MTVGKKKRRKLDDKQRLRLPKSKLKIGKSAEFVDLWTWLNRLDDVGPPRVGQRLEKRTGGSE